jgi:hypothetical protein
VLCLTYAAVVAVTVAGVASEPVTATLYVVGLFAALLVGAAVGRGWAALVPLAATVAGLVAGKVLNPACEGCGGAGWGMIGAEFGLFWAVPMAVLAAAGVALRRIAGLMPGRAGRRAA